MMSRPIWINAVCKSLLLSPVAVKELKWNLGLFLLLLLLYFKSLYLMQTM